MESFIILTYVRNILPVLSEGSDTLVSSSIRPGSRPGLDLRLGPDAPVVVVPGVLVLVGPVLVDPSGEPVFQQITCLLKDIICVPWLEHFAGVYISPLLFIVSLSVPLSSPSAQ